MKRPVGRAGARLAGACLAAAVLWLAAPVAAAPQRAARGPEPYNLVADERAGGHTLARHVGRTDEELRERLRTQRSISAASTYTDRATAERVVAETLVRARRQIDRWLARSGSRPNLALDYRGSPADPIGRSVRRGETRVLPCWDAVVVLRWDARRDFYVLTSYPERRR